MPPTQFTKVYFDLKNAITEGAGFLLFYGAKRHGSCLFSIPKAMAYVCVFVFGTPPWVSCPFQ